MAMAATSTKKYRYANRYGSSANGFDVVSSSLVEVMHDRFKTTGITSKGVVHTAHKSLRSAFAHSIKGINKAPPTEVTPSRRSSERSLRSTHTSKTSPISSFSLLCKDDDNDKVNATDRLDFKCVLQSSTTRCSRRLRIGEIIRLGYHSEFTVFIPSIHNKNEHKDIREGRSQTLAAFRLVVLSDVPHDWTPQERNGYFSDHLKTREIVREGRVGHEFNVRIKHYPERERMNVDVIHDSEAKFILDHRTGVGLNCELIGYGCSSLALIRITNLPFIEIYVPREADDCILQELKFPQTKDDTVNAGFMAREFLECKGDSIAYTNILLSYYKMAQKHSSTKERAVNAELLKSEKEKIQS